jgi:hypothetical protein
VNYLARFPRFGFAIDNLRSNLQPSRRRKTGSSLSTGGGGSRDDESVRRRQAERDTDQDLHCIKLLEYMEK